jgi:hypothetical protein
MKLPAHRPGGAAPVDYSHTKQPNCSVGTLELSIGAGGEQKAELRGMALQGFMGNAKEKR